MAYTDIDRSSDYFNTVLYTGDGSASRSITGTGFQPDFVWIKNRDSAFDNNLFDVIRGAGKLLESNTTDAEATVTTRLLSFDSDGFTTGANSNTNENTKKIVAWNWLAENTSGSSNTDGSITSTVSANTTSGFSIVSYTGTGSAGTVGHSLGTTPTMIIIKNRDVVSNWVVGHKSLGLSNGVILLNSTSASTTDSTVWNNTLPTSSVFSVGANGGSYGTTTTSNNFIAYCFAEKKGFSKFGSYTGNGNANGTFIYTGFKPAFFLIKNTNDGTDDWHIMDNKRNGYNPQNNILQPNLSDAEGSSTRVDFLSNGVKINSSSAFINGSGEKIIFMAFAENPFVTSTSIPCTAR